MRELELEFTKKGCRYTQIASSKYGYIYAVYNEKYNDSGNPSYYEVFLRKTAKEGTLPNGTVVPERVRYPNDEDFGSWAWCCDTLEKVQYIIAAKVPFFDDHSGQTEAIG